MTIQAGVDTKTVNPNDFQSVTVDDTAHEKAVSTGLKLRQNYSRKALKQLKTLVGRVRHDIERQLPAQPVAVRSAFDETLAKTRHILNQQR